MRTTSALKISVAIEKVPVALASNRLIKMDSDPFRLRICICEPAHEARNGTTGWTVPTRTGVAMNAFSAKDTREER